MCKMCSGSKHTTRWHLRRMESARRRSSVWQQSIVDAGRQKRGRVPNWKDPVARGRAISRGQLKPKARKRRRQISKRIWLERSPQRRRAISQKIAVAQEGRPFTRGHLRNLRAAHKQRRRPGREQIDYMADRDMRRLRPVILRRDGWQCRRPGCKKTVRDGRLVVHHIDHNPRRTVEENLVTVCHPCNVRAEAVRYRRQWQRQFTQYIRQMQK